MIGTVKKRKTEDWVAGKKEDFGRIVLSGKMGRYKIERVIRWKIERVSGRKI